MPDIPEAVQWLLDFANLGCRPGVFNPRKLFSDVAIKRPPVKPPPAGKEPTIVSSEEDFLLTGERCAWIDHEGHVWKKVKNKMYYEGKQNAFPFEGAIIEGDKIQYAWGTGDPLLNLEDFQRLFPETKLDSKFGFPIPINFWTRARFAVLCKTNFNKITHRDYKSYETGVLSLLELRYQNPILKKIQTSIEKLWYEHKDLHSLLTQCLCCGSFWIRDKNKKGRKGKYCSKKCKDRFNELPGNDVNKRVGKLRTANREFQRKEDVALLKKWLIDKEDYKPEEAREKAYKLVYEYRETFKNYKRKAGQKYGLLE